VMPRLSSLATNGLKGADQMGSREFSRLTNTCALSSERHCRVPSSSCRCSSPALTCRGLSNCPTMSEPLPPRMLCRFRHKSFDDDTENIVAAVLGLSAAERAWESKAIARGEDCLRHRRRDRGLPARAPRCAFALLGDGTTAVRFDRRPADDTPDCRCSARRRLDRLAL
jgi:hypothetical protein